jgi:uncharacterized membrane protein YccF (DUF307 family)
VRVVGVWVFVVGGVVVGPVWVLVGVVVVVVVMMVVAVVSVQLGKLSEHAKFTSTLYHYKLK